ncbi:MAG: phospholipase [Pseudonocardia sp.]|nr:MAG: phospholipase [Pseudonocardia sp.]
MTTDCGKPSVQPKKALTEWGAELSKAEIAVLGVHGRGQSPDFIRELTERLRVDNARFFAPHAPDNSWYPQPFLKPRRCNQPALDVAMAEMAEHLETIQAAGFAASDIFLMGFSQGACLLSHFVLTQRPAFGGLVCFTGGFVGAEPIAVPTAAFLRGVPALVRSIADDPFVPSSRVIETAHLLMAAGAHVDVRVDSGTEHIISDEAVSAASLLLRRRSQDERG